MNKIKIFWILGLAGFLFCATVQAVILDDDDMGSGKSATTASKPKTKHTQKTNDNRKPLHKASPPKVVERYQECLVDGTGRQICHDVDKSDMPAEQQTKHQNNQSVSKPSACTHCPEMIKLPSGLSMGKYEVTQGQWQAVMGSNPSNFNGFGENWPVESVSFDDVQRFIERLNSMSGKHFRLPTEDEWLGACLAGGYTDYCGSSNIEAVAWYESNSNKTTHAVGQKQPNGYGLYDMSGNVWEWTSSCWEGDCSVRVLRGGSWGSKPADVRAAERGGLDTGARTNSFGFRLAQDN